MTALPGGPADKLPNRYEDWWTIYRLGDLLTGRASTLRLEPPGPIGQGIEFWIMEQGTRWCEQVKDATSRGSWTIKRLETEHVLVAVRGHLARGDHVRFVFSTAASMLRNLCERARAANSFDEYWSTVLTEKERVDLEQVARLWEIGREQTWQWLRHVEVEHHPPESLQRLMLLRCELLIQGDPEAVVADLRNWLNDQIHQEITGSTLGEHLSQVGFPRRFLAGDPSSLEALEATTRRQRRFVERRQPQHGLVPELQTQRLVDRLTEREGPQIVVLHGAAGSGKSTVATAALSRLSTGGWFVAAVRLDVVGEGVGSARALGQAFDLVDGPVTILGGVADGSPAVLLVDQLDAVSSYAGRMPGSFDAVQDLLDQASTLPTLKVLLVVRTVDLTQDPRLRSLHHSADVGSLEAEPLELDEVCSALRGLGLNPEVMTAPTLELLRIPLHFAVFSQLTREGQLTPYPTLASLFGRRTEEVRAHIGLQLGHLDWPGIIDPLLNYLSERQVLSAPDHILDSVERSELNALDSHGLLARNGDRIAFFHETYFDYLFARRFVAAGRDLVRFLLDSGQELYWRAQVRQVLEHLADSDRQQFRRVVAAILDHPVIRPHIKEVVAIVLERLDAGSADWELLQPYVFAGPGPRRLEYLPARPTWFEAIDSLGRWPALLDDQDTVEVAGHQLVVAARHHPQRVVELIRPYLGVSESWQLRVQSLLTQSHHLAVVSLAVELLDRGELDEPPGGFADHRNLWGVIAGAVHTNPAGATQLVAAYLRRAAVRARAHDQGHPFNGGYIIESAEAFHAAGDLAAIAPADLVAAVLPALLDIAERDTSAAAHGDELRRWRISPSGGPESSTGPALIRGLDHALQTLARSDRAASATWAERLAASDVRELRFLACRVFTAAINDQRSTDRGDHALAWLESDTRNLELGWADSPLWASRELIETATRYCSPGRLDAFEKALLDYYPWWETAESGGGHPIRGHAQHHLLPAIPEDRRSAFVAERIAALDATYPHHPPHPPGTPPEVVNGPPIAPERTARLDDQGWRDAITDAVADLTPPRGGPLRDRHRQLAGQLAERARVEPGRFARLALTLDTATPAVYFERVIDATAEQLPIDLLVVLCGHARAAVPGSVGPTICRAIGARAGEATGDAISLLEDFATDPDPLSRPPQSAEPGTPFPATPDLLNRGLNTTRGAAAAAVAQLLFASPAHAPRLADTLRVLAVDREPAVRACAAEAIIALARIDADTALALTERLFEQAPIELFAAPTINRLLHYALWRRPEVYNRHLATALRGPETVAQATGATWAFAWANELLCGDTPTDIRVLPTAARQGAAASLATEPSLALDELIDLFDDPEDAVRNAAASASRFIASLDDGATQRFVHALTASASAPEHLGGLLIALDRSEQPLPEASLTACHTVISLAGPQLADLSRRHAAATPAIVNVLLRVYRDALPAVRSRCLDQIDRLCELGAHNLDQPLDQQR